MSPLSLNRTITLLLLLSLCLSLVHAEARRTGGRRTKTHGRSYSNRNNNAQSQATAHHAVQSAPKQAAPPGSVAATNSHANKAHVAPASAPQAPGSSASNIGWNVNGQKPVGPPPAYPGMGHNYASPGGQPPPYSPYNPRPPGYSHGQPGVGGVGYPQQAPNPYMQHGMAAPQMGGYGGMPMGGGYGGYGGNNYGMMGGGQGMMGGGMMGGGGMMMMGGYPQQQRSSMFSLSNVLTGVALYSMYRSLTGGFGGGGYGGGGYGGGYQNSGPREVHIYDHREHKPTDPNDLKPIMGTLGLPQSVTGEKIVLPAKTMEEIVKEMPVQNVTQTINGTETTVEDPMPPLPFDNQPKIYFGYGYAYGYQNAMVEILSAKDGHKIETLKGPSSEATTKINEEHSQSSDSTQPEDNNTSWTTIEAGSAADEELKAATATSTMKSQVE